MEFDELLNKEDRYQYLLLKYIELNKDNFMSVQLLCEVLGLSQFKVRQFLTNVQIDLRSVSSEGTILVLENNEVQATNIDLLLVKQMRLLYLNRSEQFLLLQDVLFYGHSIDTFGKNYFISKTKSYQIKKELNHFLSNYGICYKKTTIEGDELKIRNLFFGIYYEFFNGMKVVFPEEVAKIVKRTMQLLISHYDQVIPDSKMAKLTIFLNVLVTRINSKLNVNLSKDSVYNADKFKEKSELFSQFKQYFNCSEKRLLSEWCYIVLFLYGEGVIPKERLFFQTNELNKANIVAQESVKQILATITPSIHLNDADSEDYIDLLVRELECIHLNVNLFYSSVETFYLDSQFTYFSENYPELTASVTQVIGQLVRNGKVNEKVENRLYYDYLFAFLRIIDIRYIEPKVYVCVDFSHGSNYTNYIAQEILGFKNLNIEIETKITSRTDVYVSDIAVDRKVKSQIIWKNPPTSSDWEAFGNEMVYLKNDEGVRQRV